MYYSLSNPRQTWRMGKYWALSIQPNVRFEFSATSSSEWNSTFQNFQKRGQPREVYPLKFSKFFFPEVVFPFNFTPGISRICGWMARISKFSRNFRTLLGEISVLFAAESTFSKVLVKWKAPIKWWHSYLDVSWAAWIMIYILIIQTIHWTVPLGIAEFLVSNQSIPECDDFIIARKEHQNSSFSINKKLLPDVIYLDTDSA